MDPGIRAVIQKMEAKLDATKERAERSENLAKELKDEQITKIYIAKAQALPNIPGLTAEKHAPIMKVLGEDHPAEFSEVFSLLKAADALLEKSAAWSELGSERAISGGSVMNKIQKAAESLVRKDTSGMTIEDAIERCSTIIPNGTTSTKLPAAPKLRRGRPEWQLNFLLESFLAWPARISERPSAMQSSWTQTAISSREPQVLAVLASCRTILRMGRWAPSWLWESARQSMAAQLQQMMIWPVMQTATW